MKGNIAYTVDTPEGLELCIATPKEREPHRYMIDDQNVADLNEKFAAYMARQKSKEKWVKSTDSTNS